MRNATCVRTQTSKVPTSVALLFISYSNSFLKTKSESQTLKTHGLKKHQFLLIMFDKRESMFWLETDTFITLFIHVWYETATFTKLIMSV